MLTGIPSLESIDDVQDYIQGRGQCGRPSLGVIWIFSFFFFFFFSFFFFFIFFFFCLLGGSFQPYCFANVCNLGKILYVTILRRAFIKAGVQPRRSLKIGWASFLKKLDPFVFYRSARCGRVSAAIEAFRGATHKAGVGIV